MYLINYVISLIITSLKHKKYCDTQTTSCHFHWHFILGTALCHYHWYFHASLYLGLFSLYILIDYFFLLYYDWVQIWSNISFIMLHCVWEREIELSKCVWIIQSILMSKQCAISTSLKQSGVLLCHYTTIDLIMF